MQNYVLCILANKPIDLLLIFLNFSAVFEWKTYANKSPKLRKLSTKKREQKKLHLLLYDYWTLEHVYDNTMTKPKIFFSDKNYVCNVV